MGNLLLLVMLIFAVLFAVAVPTVITDLKSHRQKNIASEVHRPVAGEKKF